MDEEIFDAVFICNGHHFDPKFPEIPGIEYFKGKVMHSQSYRVPETFKGKIDFFLLIKFESRGRKQGSYAPFGGI